MGWEHTLDNGICREVTRYRCEICGQLLTSKQVIETGEPPPPSAGPWLDEMKIARVINMLDPSGTMYRVTTAIQINSLNYFLCKPLETLGSTGYKPNFRIGIRDPEQSQNMNITYPTLIKVDKNGNEIQRYIVSGSGDFSTTIKDFSQAEYLAEVAFLLEIKELGKGGQTGVEIYWKLI